MFSKGKWAKKKKKEKNNAVAACRFYHGCATPFTSLAFNNSLSVRFLFSTTGIYSSLHSQLHSFSQINFTPNFDLTRLKSALENMGISELFPVQVAVWQETLGPGNFERDLCINSPTGSGKTLGYALPIVQKLSTRVVEGIHALVVVPTRDLALQVKQVFDAIALPLGLRVGLAIAQSSRSESLVVQAHEEYIAMFSDSDIVRSQTDVDILVATPGKLMDHIHEAAVTGFTLKHLKYLVSVTVFRLHTYINWR